MIWFHILENGDGPMNIWLVGTLVIAGLLDQPTAISKGALRLTNIAIQMVRIDQTQIEARISNPNEFAVYDVLASCDFRGRSGETLTTLNLKIVDAVQANSTRRFRDFAVAEWPAEARTAVCVSKEAKRWP
jgi:hypothetical protein